LYEESGALYIDRKNSTDNSLLPQKAQRATDEMQQVGNSDKCAGWNEKTPFR